MQHIYVVKKNHIEWILFYWIWNNFVVRQIRKKSNTCMFYTDSTSDIWNCVKLDTYSSQYLFSWSKIFTCAYIELYPRNYPQNTDFLCFTHLRIIPAFILQVLDPLCTNSADHGLSENSYVCADIFKIGTLVVNQGILYFKECSKPL